VIAVGALACAVCCAAPLMVVGSRREGRLGARRTAAVLLVATAALFIVGGVLEGDEHAEPASHVEGSESEAEETAVLTSSGEESGESGESGESLVTVTLAVVASLALAAGLWFTGRRELAMLTVVLALLFLIFDAREVVHQSDEDRLGLAALAAVVAVGHLAAAGFAALSLRD
jgi:hypothetical protein